MPKAKGYVSPRHHARAAGQPQTYVNGEPKFAGFNEGDDVPREIFDAIWPKDATPAETTTASTGDLNTLKAKDLRARAVAAGIPGAARMKKADLVTALQASQPA